MTKLDEGTPETNPNAKPETPEDATPTEAGGTSDAGWAVGSDPEATTAALESQIAALKDQVLRGHAELENYRRRTEREKEEIGKYAIAKFSRDLLSVADNLRRALESAPQDGDETWRNFITGVEVTERELMTIFERNQVQRLDPLGQKFDAHFHEAVMEVEDASKPAGTIVQVMAPGYTLAGRLLRAAMVAVTRGGPRGNGNVDTIA
jgi:molecular chaperone GrpE